MPQANVSSQDLLSALQDIQQAVTSIDDTKNSLKQRYQSLSGWSDKNYVALGAVLSDCFKALNSVEMGLLQNGKKLVELMKTVQAYEDVNMGTGGSGGGTSGGGSGSGSAPLSAAEIQAEIKGSGRAFCGSLPSEQRDAINAYTGTAYQNINAVLRGREENFGPGNQERAAAIHEALGQSSLPHACTVYRGASDAALGPYANLPDDQLVGNYISDAGFMSTSLVPGDAFSGDVNLVISVPEGAHGAYVGSISQAGHYESEVLFDCDQTLYITGVGRGEDGSRIIYATMIN